MPTPTYTLIDSVTLTSSAAGINFTEIPAGGDLVLVVELISTTASGYGGQSIIYFNNETDSNAYNMVIMKGDGSSATSTSSQNQDNIQGPFQKNSSYSPSFRMEVFNYSTTGMQKSALITLSDAKNQVYRQAVRYNNTSAVTSIQIQAFDNFGAGSTAFLYNIAKAL
jgi:hypothetical protein